MSLSRLCRQVLSSGDTVCSHIFVTLLFGHCCDPACPSGSERTSSGRPSEHIANGTWKQRWVRLDPRIHFHQKQKTKQNCSQFPHPNRKAKIRYSGGKTEEGNNPVSEWPQPLLSDEPRGASRSFQKLQRQHLQLQPAPSHSEQGYAPMPLALQLNSTPAWIICCPFRFVSERRKKKRQSKTNSC